MSQIPNRQTLLEQAWECMESALNQIGRREDAKADFFHARARNLMLMATHSPAPEEEIRRAARIQAEEAGVVVEARQTEIREMAQIISAFMEIMETADNFQRLIPVYNRTLDFLKKQEGG